MNRSAKKSPKNVSIKKRTETPSKGQKTLFEFFTKSPPPTKPTPEIKNKPTESADVSFVNVSSEDEFQPKRIAFQKKRPKTKTLGKLSPRKDKKTKRKRKQSSGSDVEDIIPGTPQPKTKQLTTKINLFSKLKIQKKLQAEKAFTSTPLDPVQSNYSIVESMENTSIQKIDEFSSPLKNILNEVKENCDTKSNESEICVKENGFPLKNIWNGIEIKRKSAEMVASSSMVAQTSQITDNLTDCLEPVTDSILSLSLDSNKENDPKEKLTTCSDDEMVGMLDGTYGYLDDTIIKEQEPDTLNLSTWQSCKVVHIFHEKNIKIVKFQSSTSTATGTSILKQQWVHFNLQIKDHVNVLAKKNFDGKYEINNDFGFVILHPNTLVSGTTLMSTLWCRRKTIIANLYGNIISSNKIMTYGSLIHELLQETLKRKAFASIAIKSIAHEIVERNETIQRLYECEITTAETLNELLPFCNKIANFVQTYVPDSNQTYDFKQRGLKSGNWDGYITKILDIEENLWCPTLGIKGKVDVSLDVKSNTMFEKQGTKAVVIPLELKTGKASMTPEHVGQLALYNMMLRELGYDSPTGLLLYLRHDVIKEVSVKRREERDLMILRNNLVYYLKQNVKVIDRKDQNDINEILDNGSFETSIKLPEIPEVLCNERVCKNCEAITVCSFLETKLNEEEYKPTTYSFYEPYVHHLTSQHIQYFKHWIKAIQLELLGSNLHKPVSDIWDLKPSEREAKGQTLSDLVVKSIDFVNGYHRTLFVSNELQKTKDFSKCGLTLRNYLIVSSLERVGLAAGFVVEITKNTISIDLERNLNKRYPGYIFTLDFYEAESRLISSCLSSLTLLMDQTEKAEKLRKIVIEGMVPIYKKTIPKKLIEIPPDYIQHLNQMQINVVYKTIATKDYLLINGMPGTGKTSTIVALIEVLNFLKKSVIITSHTHSAVDNVLEKLLKNNRVPKEQILKLGTEFRTNPHVQSRCENILVQQYNSVEELDNFYKSISVVGVTCLGSNHSLLNRRCFNFCIVDESTQVIQPILFKPILSAEVFVLVGDPEQLPPIVRNDDAKKLGMTESLFERLQDSSCTEKLAFQYRMNNTINDLANKFTYKGGLLCGNTKVAQTRLKYKEEMDPSVESWVKQICDTKIENAVYFVNTKSTANFNQEYLDNELLPFEIYNFGNPRLETTCSNVCEAAIILKLVSTFLKLGIKMDDIGIIAPFQMQVSLLKSIINDYCSTISEEQKIEISTVDQYQGRDKRLMIISCTKADTGQVQDFGILADKRRLNVAITRAKNKLIIIGDEGTLQTYQTFKHLFNCLKPSQKLNVTDYFDFHWSTLLDGLNHSNNLPK